MLRAQLMKTHALLAAFILPAAIMFITTGAFYTWGIKGSYIDDVYTIQLNQPIQPKLNELIALAELELTTLNLSKPSGTAKLETISKHFLLEWTGSDKDLTLEPTDNELIAKMTVKNASWYRSFVQLHKAKGGVAFKVYAVILALSIASLLFSGLLMAWQTPKLKRITLMTALLGMISFIAAVLLS